MKRSDLVSTIYVLPPAAEALFADWQGQAAYKAFLKVATAAEGDGLSREDICWGIIRAVRRLYTRCRQVRSHRTWAKAFVRQWGQTLEKEAKTIFEENAHPIRRNHSPTFLDDCSLDACRNSLDNFIDNPPRDRVMKDMLALVQSMEEAGTKVEPLCRGLMRTVMVLCREGARDVWSSDFLFGAADQFNTQAWATDAAGKEFISSYLLARDYTDGSA